MPSTAPAVITAQVIDEHVLEPTTNAIAATDVARDALHNPRTMEIDSALEALALIRWATTVAVNKVIDAAAAGGSATHYQQRVSGWADQLNREMRDLELNSPSKPLAGRMVAGLLQEPLSILGDPTLAARHDMARDALYDAFAMVPRTLLFRQAVSYHLGKSRVALMAIEHDAWVQNRGNR